MGKRKTKKEVVGCNREWYEVGWCNWRGYGRLSYMEDEGEVFNYYLMDKKFDPN